MKRLILAAALLASISSAFASPVISDPTIIPGVVRTRGLSMTDRADYQIDHLMPLGIGGIDDNANPWPQPRKTIETEWTAELKDATPEPATCLLLCLGLAWFGVQYSFAKLFPKGAHD